MKMKLVLLFLIGICVPGIAATASGATPDNLEAPPLPSDFLNAPDFLGPDTVPLSRRERDALRLTRDWSGRGPAPVLSPSGKLIYVHGASTPTILASPMQVCDRADASKCA